MFYVFAVRPVIDLVVAAKADRQEDHTGDRTYNRNTGRDRFCNTSECKLPSAPGERGSAHKEHCCIYYQQEVYTVLQQAAPEPCLLVRIIFRSCSHVRSNDRQDADNDQTDCYRIISFRRYEI